MAPLVVIIREKLQIQMFFAIVTSSLLPSLLVASKRVANMLLRVIMHVSILGIPYPVSLVELNY